MLTIGQVASRAGLRASAIRYYESQGLLPVASRAGGKRTYPESILQQLAVIAGAKMAGFELEEIRAVLTRVGQGQPAAVWRTAARAKQAELRDQMKSLALTEDIAARIAGCTCTTLEECGRGFNAASATLRAGGLANPRKPRAHKHPEARR